MLRLVLNTDAPLEDIYIEDYRQALEKLLVS